MSNHRIFLIVSFALIVLVLPCCKGEESSSQGNRGVLQPPPIDDEGANRGAIGDVTQTYTGPAFTIDVLVMESFPEQYAALFNVTTNTGGWNLALDHTEWSGGTLKAYLTLEGPAPDELVTQALEDHEARYAAGTTKIEMAEAWVRITTRGEETEKPYLLAATTE